MLLDLVMLADIPHHLHHQRVLELERPLYQILQTLPLTVLNHLHGTLAIQRQIDRQRNQLQIDLLTLRLNNPPHNIVNTVGECEHRLPVIVHTQVVQNAHGHDALVFIAQQGHELRQNTCLDYLSPRDRVERKI